MITHEMAVARVAGWASSNKAFQERTLEVSQYLDESAATIYEFFGKDSFVLLDYRHAAIKVSFALGTSQKLSKELDELYEQLAEMGPR